MPMRKTPYSDYATGVRRTRRPAEPGNFHDPLGDYSPKPFDDRLEEDLLELSIADMNPWPPIVVKPDDTVDHAITLMRERDFGCALVIDDAGKLVGIFSERDALDKIAGNHEKSRHLPVQIVMTHDPVTVYDTDPPAKALNMMATGSFRHLPVLDTQDNVVGVLGPRRVTGFLLKYFATP